MICQKVSDFLTVRSQCVSMLLDRGASKESIPNAPPKSLLSRYLSISHEKGNSPLLDLPHPENPVLFLYEKGALGKVSAHNRILNTLTYHSIDISNKITVVLLGSKYPESLEEALSKTFPMIQVFHWETLMNPIQNHMLVPTHTPVTKETIDTIMKKFKLFTIY